MSRNLLGLSDEQLARIKPQLPTDVRGVERADDRRVISGIVHVLKGDDQPGLIPDPAAQQLRPIYQREVVFYRTATARKVKLRSGMQPVRKPPTLLVSQSCLERLSIA